MSDGFVTRLRFPNQKALTHYFVPYHFDHLPRTRPHGKIPKIRGSQLYTPLPFANRRQFHLFSAQFGLGVPVIDGEGSVDRKPSRRENRGDYSEFSHLTFVYPFSAVDIEGSLQSQVASLEDRCGHGALIWEISRRRPDEPVAEDASLRDQLVRILLEDHSSAVARESHWKELERRHSASLAARHPEEERQRALEKRRQETQEQASRFRSRLLSLKESEMMRRENQEMAHENRLARMHSEYLEEQSKLESTRKTAVESMKELQELRSEEEKAQRKNQAQKEESDRHVAMKQKSRSELAERMNNWVYLHQTINESREIDRDYYRNRLLTLNYYLCEIESRQSEGIRSLKELLSLECRLSQEMEDCTKEIKILEITINFLGNGETNLRSGVKESKEEMATLRQSFEHLSQRYASIQRNRRECESGLQRLCILKRQKRSEKEETLDNIRGLLQYKIELVESVYPFSLLYGSRRSINSATIRPKFSSKKSTRLSKRRTFSPAGASFDVRLSMSSRGGASRMKQSESRLRIVHSTEADGGTESSESPRTQTLEAAEDSTEIIPFEEVVEEEENLVAYREIYEDIVSLQDLLRDDSCAFPDPISLAAIIRKKPFFIRTDQERQWIAIDYRIHRELYESISDDERTLIETHPSFFFKISEQRLSDLSRLSGILSEAIGEVESAQEWHIYLVNQEVSQGKNDQSREHDDSNTSIESQEFLDLYSRYLQQLENIRKRKEIDEEKVLFTVLDGILHPELYTRPYTSDRFSFTQQELLNALYNDYSALSPVEREAVELYNKFNPAYIHSQIDQTVRSSSVIMKNITDLESILLLNKTIFSSRRSCTLLDETASFRRLYAAESYEHKMVLPLETLSSLLTVTIKYHGESRGQYFPGRLSALLYYTSGSAQIPIGYSKVSDIQLNTAEKEGFIVIHHHPKQIPLLPGVYTLLLRSFSRVYYTAKVEAEIIDPLKATLHRTESEVSEVVSSMHMQQKEIRMYSNIRSLLVEKRSVCLEVIQELDSELTDLLSRKDIESDRHAPYHEKLLEIERQYLLKDRLAVLIQTVGDKLNSIKASSAVLQSRFAFFRNTLPHCYEIMKVSLPVILKSDANRRPSIALEDYQSILCPLSAEETRLCPLADDSDPRAHQNRAELRLKLRCLIYPPVRGVPAMRSSVSRRLRSPRAIAPFCDASEVSRKLRTLSRRTEPCLYAYWEEKLEIDELNQSLLRDTPIPQFQDALARRDRLLVRQVSYEVFHHALEEMYTGWHFGEMQKTDHLRTESVQLPPSPALPSAESLLRAESLDNEERTLRFGLFAVTMQFFRSMHFLRKMKQSFGATASEPASSTAEGAGLPPEATPPPPKLTLPAFFTQPYSLKKQIPLREKYSKQRAAVVLQRHWRGWLTRTLYQEYTRISSANLVNQSLRTAAAVCIQRHCRGFFVRKRHIVALPARHSAVYLPPVSIRISSVSFEYPQSHKDESSKVAQLPQVYRKKGLLRRELVEKPSWLDSREVNIGPQTIDKLFEFAFS